MQYFNCYPWQHWAIVRATETAFIIDDKTLSWQQLNSEVNRFVQSFYQQGVQSQQLVVLRGKNSAQLLFVYLAVLQLGCRVLVLNPQLPATLLAELLPQLSVDFVWCEEQYHWPIKATKSLIAATSNVQTNNSITSNSITSCWLPDQASTMTLTSGSGGQPKAVVHSINNHLANADGLLEKMTFTANDSWLLSLPLFHVSGQGILWRWLLKGACLVLRDLHFINEALRGCTHASLVPTQLWRLLNDSVSELSLKQVLLGGATIPLELTQQAVQQGINCWCGYGMTEMASTCFAKQADLLPGVGQLLPNREFHLTENDEICLRGPSLALGYWVNSQLSLLQDDSGWYHTRDRGVIENSELRILGRIDNLFFSGGEGIQPEDIERVLNHHPQVISSIVVPVADNEFGHRSVAVIQCDADFVIDSLSEWIANKIARFQHPIAYYRMPDDLLNSGIKISRQAVSHWLISVR